MSDISKIENIFNDNKLNPSIEKLIDLDIKYFIISFINICRFYIIDNLDLIQTEENKTNLLATLGSLTAYTSKYGSKLGESLLANMHDILTNIKLNIENKIIEIPISNQPENITEITDELREKIINSAIDTVKEYNRKQVNRPQIAESKPIYGYEESKLTPPPSQNRASSLPLETSKAEQKRRIYPPGKFNIEEKPEQAYATATTTQVLEEGAEEKQKTKTESVAAAEAAAAEAEAAAAAEAEAAAAAEAGAERERAAAEAERERAAAEAEAQVAVKEEAEAGAVKEEAEAEAQVSVKEEAAALAAAEAEAQVALPQDAARNTVIQNKLQELSLINSRSPTENAELDFVRYLLRVKPNDVYNIYKINDTKLKLPQVILAEITPDQKFDFKKYTKNTPIIELLFNKIILNKSPHSAPLFNNEPIINKEYLNNTLIIDDAYQLSINKNIIEVENRSKHIYHTIIGIKETDKDSFEMLYYNFNIIKQLEEAILEFIAFLEPRQSNNIILNDLKHSDQLPIYSDLKQKIKNIAEKGKPVISMENIFYVKTYDSLQTYNDYYTFMINYIKYFNKFVNSAGGLAGSSALQIPSIIKNKVLLDLIFNETFNNIKQKINTNIIYKIYNLPKCIFKYNKMVPAFLGLSSRVYPIDKIEYVIPNELKAHIIHIDTPLAGPLDDIENNNNIIKALYNLYCNLFDVILQIIKENKNITNINFPVFTVCHGDATKKVKLVNRDLTNKIFLYLLIECFSKYTESDIALLTKLNYNVNGIERVLPFYKIDPQ